MNQLRAPALAAWLADDSRSKPLLLDVREGWEFELCRLDGAQLMPMQTIPARCHELDPNQTIVVICHHGMRSQQVGRFLESQDFTDIHNLVGGVAAWAEEVDPQMPRY